MKRKEEREEAAKQSIKGDSFEDGCIGKGYFIIGAEWADENPDKNNVYTKQELREMGFGFTLNGDIVTPKEEEEMTEKYIKYKQKHLIDKACEWLEKNFNMPNDFEYHFRKAMEGE